MNRGEQHPENGVKELTRAELELMRILWSKEQAFLGDIVDAYPLENRPAYPTISTVVRILEKKGFVSHETFGKVNRYYPLVSKDYYRRRVILSVLSVFFNDSPAELYSVLEELGVMHDDEVEQIGSMVERRGKSVG